MYNIEFYEDSDGRSELWEFLESLRVKTITNKDARIQYSQISLYIQLLEDNGTRLNENITKHLVDNIWELRPGSNRIIYFYFKNNTFVLLHQFRKKTQNSAKKLKKHPNGKLIRQRQSVMITSPERRPVYYENLE